MKNHSLAKIHQLPQALESLPLLQVKLLFFGDITDDLPQISEHLDIILKSSDDSYNSDLMEVEPLT